jgi:hypothetical protein
MSDEEEHESRCGESFPRSAPKPQRSTATSARCPLPLAIRVQDGARGEIWFAAPQRRYLRAIETLRSRLNQRSASVNLPKHLAGAIPTFS